MRLKLSEKERKGLLEILDMDLQGLAQNMGESIPDILKSADAIKISADIYRRLKAAGGRWR